MYTGRNASFEIPNKTSHRQNLRWDWNWFTHFNSVKIGLMVTAWLKIHIDNLTTLYQNRILEVSFFVHISQCKILQLSLTFRNAWTKFHLNYSPSCLQTIWFFMSTGGPTCQRLLMMCRRCPRPSGPTYLGSIYLLLLYIPAITLNSSEGLMYVCFGEERSEYIVYCLKLTYYILVRLNTYW